MKTRTLLAVIMLVVLTTASAFDKKPSSVTTREIATSQVVNRVIIGNNVKVILVADDNYPAITLTGDADILKSINVSMVGDQLTISSGKNLKDKKILIHVPVQNLSYLELKSGSEIAVQGVISCTNLQVIVNSDAHLALKYIGKATIKAADDCEFVYERQESSTLNY